MTDKEEVIIYGFLVFLLVLFGAGLGTTISDSVIRDKVCKQLYPTNYNSYINCCELMTNKVYEKIKPIEIKGEENVDIIDKAKGKGDE